MKDKINEINQLLERYDENDIAFAVHIINLLYNHLKRSGRV